MDNLTFIDEKKWFPLVFYNNRSNYAMRYGLAIAMSLIALVVSWLLLDIFRDRPFVVFSAAVTLTAWAAGMWPSLLCSALSIFFAEFILTEPSQRVTDAPLFIMQFIFFMLLAVVIGWTQELSQRTQLHLRAAQKERDDILQSVPEGIVVQTVEGKIVYINKAAASLIGYSIKSPLDMASVSLEKIREKHEILDEDGNIVPLGDRPHPQVVNEGKSAQRLLCRRHKETREEKWIYLMASPIFDERNKVKLVVSAVQDVTLRRESEQELKRLNGLLQRQKKAMDNFIAQVPGIIWEIKEPSKEGELPVAFMSDYLQTMLGYTEEDWSVDPANFWVKVVYPEDADYLQEQIAHVFKTGESLSFQVRTLTKDGRIVPVEVRVDLALDEDNKPIGLRGVTTDITERWESTQKLEHFTQELQRSNSELQQFAYVASHDLQEPLRMVASYLQLIEERYKGKLSEEATEFIGFAVDGATRMKRLINDLLVYSRIQRSTADFKEVDVQQVLTNVINDLHFIIEDTKAQINFDTMPKILGNEMQLRQLFQNLIGNALKFRRDIDPVVHISAEESKDEWVFSVADNGIGIDAKYADRIFVVFQRLHSANKYPGTGIGLAICRKVVENHNGRIWIESTLGSGTTFLFAIPKDKLNKRSRYESN